MIPVARALPAPPATATAATDWRGLAQLGGMYLTKFPGWTAAYGLLAILNQSVLPVAVTLFFTQLINRFSAVEAAAEADRSSLSAHYAAWVGLSLAALAVNFAHRYATAIFDAKMGASLRQDAFAAVLAKDLRFFHETDPGRLNATLNQLTLQAQIAIRQLLVDPVTQAVSLAVVGMTLLQQIGGLAETEGAVVWWVFAGLTLFAVASPWLVGALSGKLSSAAAQLQDEMMRMNTLVTTTMSSPEEIKALRAESLFAQRHRDALDSLTRKRLGQTASLETINLVSRAPGDLVLFGLIGLAVAVAVAAPDAGLKPGLLVAIALLTPQFMLSAQMLANLTISSSLAWPAIAEIKGILAPTARSAGQDDRPSTLRAPALDFDSPPPIVAAGLTFRYRPGSPAVFDQAAFEAPGGLITGLVARPGRGKTTFFRLLLRFCEPESGAIRLGARELATVAPDDVRRAVMLVSQHPAFFHDTVRTNFRVACPDADDAAIFRACESHGLWEILVNSYGQSPLDAPFAAGARLSGGQKKQFALIRCLLNKPSVLLLDEPTTGMGALEKAPLTEPLKLACAGRTTILVDHDILWQMAVCDWFLVLDEGKIMEQGTRDELLRRGGIFAGMAEAARHQAR
jgi:ABC-type multidrug transport system fused ATPase/permease subunit